MTSNQKIVICGNTIHHYKYNKQIIYGTDNKEKVNAELYREMANSESDQPRPDDPNAYRVKRNIRRIIESNAGHWTNRNGNRFLPIFVTLTFEADVETVQEANPIFKRFIQRLNRRVNSKEVLKYIVTVEFQKLNRKAVHYHMVFFNLPWIPKIYDFFNEVWGQGNVNVKATNGLTHLKNYIAKYISKEERDVRLMGRKKYFCARGLKRPIEYRDQILVEFLMLDIEKQPPEYRKEYYSEDTQILTTYSCYEQRKLNPYSKIRQYQTLIKHNKTLLPEQLSFSL
jgi:hypothetical protein